MKVEYINPFIESVFDVFTTMLSSQATRGGVGVSKGKTDSRDIMAIIGLSGEARGMVALSFPTPTALAMVSRLLGTALVIVDETVYDGLAELVNMVAGSAKAKFANSVSVPIALSLPTVIRGSDFSVNHPSQATWLDVPFSSELGTFNLRVTFELSKEKGATQ